MWHERDYSSEDYTMTDTDGIWDPESNRYYYPEYVTGSHGEKVALNPAVDTTRWKHPAQDHNRAEVLPDSAKDIAAECDRIKAFLVEKNLKYGNSALEPVRIFSNSDTVEQLLVRIDDKLSRMQRGSDYADEDTILDLIGYLILLRVAEA